MLRNQHLTMTLVIAHEPTREKDEDGNERYAVDPWRVYAHWKSNETNTVVLSEEVYSADTLFRAIDYVRYRDREDGEEQSEKSHMIISLMDKAYHALEEAGLVGPLDNEG